MKLRELATWVGGTVVGDPNREISRVSEPEQATSDSIVLAGDARALSAAEAGEAAAVLIPEDLAPARKPAIRARNVRLAFAKLLERFAPPPGYPEGVHRTAVVGTQVVLGNGVGLGPHVSIAEGARIGTGTVILAGAAIGRGVVIGEQCIIHANATIREHCQLGNRVIIHAGAVIGSDGFGYAEGEDLPVKIPHLGRVVIEDEVEIGANTTIDRATLGETRVGRGTKIDNLVQVAHNVRIGRGVIIVGQVGISGSVSIGDGAVLAGQAGVPDHVNVGARARLLARAVPTKDVPSGGTLSGFPAQAHREELRQQAVLRRLPEILDRLETLENRLLSLEKARSIMAAPPPREQS